MFEFHGWAKVQEAAAPIEEKNIDKIADLIRIKIREQDWNTGILELCAINGEYHLVFSGFTNHKGKDAKDIFNLLGYIGNIAGGSYGLLYIRDDEDISGKDNEFQVFALVRGKLKGYKDPFLSPVVPILEDEEE